MEYSSKYLVQKTENQQFFSNFCLEIIFKARFFNSDENNKDNNWQKTHSGIPNNDVAF
jgi:hypothetical protein